MTGRKTNSGSGCKGEVRIKEYQSLEEIWKQIDCSANVLACRVAVPAINEQSSMCKLERLTVA